MEKRFSNPYIRDIKRSIWHFLRWQLGHYQEGVPVLPQPEGFSYPLPSFSWDAQKPSVTWINHCTFLIEIEGVRILTDPIWSNRCSPIPFLGPKRRHKPPYDLKELPPIDVVLISHNHYDHLDAYTVKKLHERFPHISWFLPHGVGKWFRKRGIHNIKELRWWQEALFERERVKFWITSVPAQHHSGRGLFDADRSLWMGFVVKSLRQEASDKTFYFSGDTAYNPFDFKKIGERFSSIDLSLCPIGTYAPGVFMQTVHASPEDAVRIHLDTKSQLSVGMHWKTFKLSDEGLKRPPYDLYLAMKKYNLNPTTFLPLEPGIAINW